MEVLTLWTLHSFIHSFNVDKKYLQNIAKMLVKTDSYKKNVKEKISTIKIVR